MKKRVNFVAAVGGACVQLLTCAAGAAGGDDCASATVILGPLPYTDTGSTCMFGNRYGEACPNQDSAPDVVYRYPAPADECVDVSLCGTTSGTDLKLYVYSSAAGGCPPVMSGDTGNDIACDDSACAPYAEITDLNLSAGANYWIVVDAANDSCGGYRLDISPCVTECVDDSDCYDGNECTFDVCDAGACQNPPRPANAPCGDPTDTTCDHPDKCDGAGVCQPNLEPDGTACDDGEFCIEGEVCLGGVCGGGSPLDCSDSDPCTADSCDEGDDCCVHSSIPDCCKTDADCFDGNECTNDVCVEHVCENTPVFFGTPCGDPSDTDCTNPDSCDHTGNCHPRHINEGGPCDDGDSCTDNDACLEGICVGTPSGACAACPPPGPGTDPMNQLSFQAVLKDDLGHLVQGPVDLTFRFYNLDGGQQGSEITLPMVPVVDGIVSITVPVNELIFDGHEGRELGVSVNGTPELTPRLPLTSAPQAFRVNCVSGDEMVDTIRVGSAQASGKVEIFGNCADGARSCVPTGMFDGTAGKAYMDDGYYVRDPDSGAMHAVMMKIGPCGYQALKNGMEETTVELKGCSSAGDDIPYGNDGGELHLADGNGNDAILLDAQYRGGPAVLFLYDPVGAFKAVQIAASETEGGQMTLRNSDSTPTVELDSESGVGARLRLAQDDYDPGSSDLKDDFGVILDGSYEGYGRMRVRNTTGATTVYVEGDEHGGGRIRVRNAEGDTRIALFGDYDGTGLGRIRADVLEIRGGLDVSEQFAIHAPEGALRPGIVVSVDPTHPGDLTISSRAYDRRVAGILSGAGGIKPGMVMGQSGVVVEGGHAVALTGRVYCWADASNDPIRPGDLLTTSATAGHAMKVTDYAKAQGAIIGKAMTALETGQGLVLVLVTLQ